MAAQSFNVLEPFDPAAGDWPSYIERLDQYFICNEVTDDAMKRAKFITMVGPSCYTLLKTLCAPDPPATKSIDALLGILTTHFQPARIEIAERFNFYKRRQGRDESIAEYKAALQKGSEFCGFGNYLNTALRDAFVIGLGSSNMQKNLLKEPNLTFQRAVELATAAEAVEKNLKRLKNDHSGEPGPTNRVDHRGPNSRGPNQSRIPPKGQSRNPPKSKPNPHSRGATSGPECHRCGDRNHLAPDCPFIEAKCHACGKTGHLQKKCQNGRRFPTGQGSSGTKPPRHPTHRVDPQDQGDSDPYPTYGIFSVGAARPAIVVSMELDGQAVDLEVDTGAALTIMGQAEWNRKFPSRRVQSTSCRLQDYNYRPIQTVGEATVRVTYRGRQHSLPVIVVEGDRPTLLGRNWLQEIHLDWPVLLRQSIGSVRAGCGLPTSGSSVQGEYPDVFGPGLGCWTGPPAKLRVKPDAVPKFHKPRPVPLAMRDQVEAALDKMVADGVLEPVDHAEWSSPIVPVKKPNGDIRICADFKVTINSELLVDKYPLPRNEEAFSRLAGGQEYSVLDMSQAFFQVPMAPESRDLLVINTHKGLFRYTRLPFGVAPATAILQKRMGALIQGIPNVAVRVDDIIVTGKTRQEHLQSLRKVLDRFREHNLRLNLKKCQLFQKSVTYLGHVISKEGIRPCPKNVQAILEAPTPKCLAEVESFLGFLQYYSKYIPNLSTLAHPLNSLHQKGVKFIWGPTQASAFKSLKEVLASSKVLAHYDPSLPLVVQCDASPVGVGAVLSQIYPDGSERPVDTASRTLTKAERGYAQIEKEGLSLVFGVTRFHQYTYGRKFRLRTDHKPLTYIFEPAKGIPVTASARIQRWGVKLQGYDYDIEHIPGSQNGNADALSRLPLPESPGEDELEDISVLRVIHEENQGAPWDFTKLAQETQKDPILSKCLVWTQQGWPAKLPKGEPSISPYFSRSTDITVEAGCLLMSDRLIIPKSLQESVLNDLHMGHPGMTRMKMLARAKVWWPCLDAQVEAKCRSCDGCARNSNMAPDPARHNQWPQPSEKWERLHLDFAGPIDGHWYLILVDAASNWPEVCHMSQATTENTTRFLRSVFSREGLPLTLVTDNGAQFTSAHFQESCWKNGIDHVCTPPYHPASNGEAEKMVQNFKRAFKAMAAEPGSTEVKIQRFLFSYRNTPSVATGKSPAEYLRGRALRSRTDQLAPRPKYPPGTGQQPSKAFSPGTPIWIRQFLPGSSRWIPGTVKSRVSTWMYEVERGGVAYRRHPAHLKRRTGPATEPTDDPDEEWDIRTDPPFPPPGNQGGPPPGPPDPNPPIPPAPAAGRYPQRHRRPIDRMGL